MLPLLVTTFLVLLVTTAVVWVVLNYHWNRHQLDRKTKGRFRKSYAYPIVLFFLVMIVTLLMNL
jgi:hypothetical protein